MVGNGSNGEFVRFWSGKRFARSTGNQTRRFIQSHTLRQIRSGNCGIGKGQLDILNRVSKADALRCQVAIIKTQYRIRKHFEFKLTNHFLPIITYIFNYIRNGIRICSRSITIITCFINRNFLHIGHCTQRGYSESISRDYGCIILTLITAENFHLRTIQPFELGRRTDCNRRINNTSFRVFYPDRIVAALGGAPFVCTVSRLGRNRQVLKGIGGTTRQQSGGLSIHGVHVIRSSTYGMNNCRTIVTTITGHICDLVHHHFQFSGHEHVAAFRLSADAIRKLYRVMIARIIYIGQCNHRRIGVVRCSHHIGVRSGAHICERPRHRSFVIDHPAELSRQGQLALLGTYITGLVTQIDGDRRLHRNAHFHHQITSGLTNAVGGYHMVGQLHIARRGVNETGIVHRGLAFIVVGIHILYSVGRVDIRSRPCVKSSSFRDIHHRYHIKAIFLSRAQDRRLRNTYDSQRVVLVHVELLGVNAVRIPICRNFQGIGMVI